MERPLRLAGTDPERVYKPAEIKKLKAEAQKDENDAPIIRKVLPASAAANPLEGMVAVTLNGKPAVVEYEPDTDLRDTEQVPLLHPGGIAAFLQEEVLPYAPDAWYNPEAVRVGYEINFNRHFYKPQPMRSLEEIRADILTLERETEGLLAEVIRGGPTMSSIPSFQEGSIESLAKILGDCGSGSDISRVLADRGIHDSSRRVYEMEETVPDLSGDSATGQVCQPHRAISSNHSLLLLGS